MIDKRVHVLFVQCCSEKIWDFFDNFCRKVIFILTLNTWYEISIDHQLKIRMICLLYVCMYAISFPRTISWSVYEFWFNIIKIYLYKKQHQERKSINQSIKFILLIDRLNCQVALSRRRCGEEELIIGPNERDKSNSSQTTILLGYGLMLLSGFRLAVNVFARLIGCHLQCIHSYWLT